MGEDRLAALVRQVQSVFLFGNGAPSGAPAAPRAVYVRFDGTTGSTFYVWDGSAWTGVA